MTEQSSMSSTGEIILGLVVLAFLVALGVCFCCCIWKTLQACFCSRDRHQRRQVTGNNPVEPPSSPSTLIRPNSTRLPARNTPPNDRSAQTTITSAAAASNTRPAAPPADTTYASGDDSSEDNIIRDPPMNPSFLDPERLPMEATILIEGNTMYANFGVEQGLASMEEESCPICLQEYEQDEMIWTSRNCRHVFHTDCIHEWMENGQSVCPVCRTTLVSDC